MATKTNFEKNVTLNYRVKKQKRQEKKIGIKIKEVPASTIPNFWTGQGLHFGVLSLLLILGGGAWRYIGAPFAFAFWIAIILPIIHQTFVWVIWRYQLHFLPKNQQIIKFSTYLVIFFLLFLGRFVSLLTLAWLDKGSFSLSFLLTFFLIIFLAGPSVYALYSVVKYFGWARAAGGDHFDFRYRDRPLVRKGIFRFTQNGMYLYAFLMFWVIALAFNSTTAVIVVAFSHAYIWVHYYATEKPDMDYLYKAVEN